jgi:hypothetical protein
MPVKEPSTGFFKLWVDIYDLVQCPFLNTKVKIEATIGRESRFSKPGRYREAAKVYTWKKKGNLEEI